MRLGWPLFLLATVGIASSQTLTSPGTALMVAAKAIPRPPQSHPLEPSGFPGLPPKEGELPPPRPYGPEERQLRIEQGNWSNQGHHIKANGGVHAIYKGYDIYATELDGDTAEQIFTMNGDVKVIGADSVVTGQTVTVNFRDRSFKSFNADVDMRPAFLGGRTLDDVYFKGGTTYGSRREVYGFDSDLTTCNLDHPHFLLKAESSDLRPGKRIILRKVTINLLGRDLIKLPYLSIPLDDRSQKYLPEIGQSQDEGYYIKFRYPIPLKGRNNQLDARVDYFSKLGNGLGLDYYYENEAMQGYLKAYGIIGRQKTLSIDQSHQGRLGAVTISVQNNYQKQNYLTAPENTLLNSRVSLGWNQRDGSSTNFTFYRTSNESSDFKSVFQTITLNDMRSFGRRTRTSLDLTLSDSSSSFAGGQDVLRSQLDVRFLGTHDFSKATAQLDFQKSIPIGDTANFFGSPDRTPVLTLSSDSSRIFGSRWSSGLPVRAEFSLGEFGNPAALSNAPDHISRGFLDLGITRTDRDRGRFGVNMDLQYRQGVYSDGTAQYQVGYNAGTRYTLTQRSSINVRYNYLQGHGFTPLDFDRSGRSNLLTTDVSVEPLRRLQIGLQTGYDFLQEEAQETAWQSIGARLEWNPTDSVQFRALNTYDTFSKAWSNVRLDLGWRAGATFVAAGARYDGIRHTWGNVNLYVDGFKTGRLKTSLLFAYNGYLQQFEARHVSFTYDLHCAEAIFQIIDSSTGFRPGTTYAFFIRLKAFPFDTPFGLGRSGQSFGTGTGRDGF